MKNGFTLIELLVVVLIVGILSAIAIPQYTRAVEKSRVSEAVSVLRSMKDAQQAYRLINGEYASDINKLEIEFPGNDVMVSGDSRKNTKYYSYRAISGPDFYGVANRIPTNQYYIVIGSLRGFICRPYSDRGTDLCKSFGGASAGESGFESYFIY